MNKKQLKTYEGLLDKYQVKVRTAPEIVVHETYGMRTIVQPQDFALYEIALKSNWLNHALFHKARNDIGSLDSAERWYRHIGAKNGIVLPFLKTEWGLEKAQDAAEDYHFAASILKDREGVLEKGGTTNLYYSLLD